MEFSDAVTYFDNDPVSDGYTGTYLWDAQTASFNDATSDGSTSRRRVLSAAPGLAMPARRVILLYGDRWLAGNGTVDGFQGSTVRQNFTLKKATDLFAILTPAQALAAAAGTAAYVQKTYFKDVVNNLTDSEYDTFWNVFLAPGEPVVKGTFFRDAGGRIYRVRNDYLPLEGLIIAQTDALDTGAVTTATFQTGARDPITELFVAGTAAVAAIKLDTPQFFRFLHASSPKTEPGDLAVYVPASTTVLVGNTFTMDGSTWRVLDKQTELDALVLHVRRA